MVILIKILLIFIILIEIIVALGIFAFLFRIIKMLLKHGKNTDFFHIFSLEYFKFAFLLVILVIVLNVLLIVCGFLIKVYTP